MRVETLSSCLVIVRKLPTITLICSREKRVRHLSIYLLRERGLRDSALFLHPHARTSNNTKEKGTAQLKMMMMSITDGPLLSYTMLCNFT